MRTTSVSVPTEAGPCRWRPRSPSRARRPASAKDRAVAPRAFRSPRWSCRRRTRRLVLPTNTAPAARRRAVTGASSVATSPPHERRRPSSARQPDRSGPSTTSMPERREPGRRRVTIGGAGGRQPVGCDGDERVQACCRSAIADRQTSTSRSAPVSPRPRRATSARRLAVLVAPGAGGATAPDAGRAELTPAPRRHRAAGAVSASSVAAASRSAAIDAPRPEQRRHLVVAARRAAATAMAGQSRALTPAPRFAEPPRRGAGGGW